MADAVQDQTTSTPAPTGPTSYSQDDITVESNHASVETLKEAFAPTEPAPKADAPAKSETPAPARDETGKFTNQPKVAAAKPRNDPQSRIDQAIARQRDAERRVEALERRVRESEAAQSAPKPAAEQPKPEPAWKRYRAMPDAPQLGDFETIEDYNFAVGHFIHEKQQQEHDQRDQQRQQFTQRDQALHARATQFSERMTAVTEKDPEFLARIDPRLVELVPISALPQGHAPTFGNAVAEAFVRSESPAALMEFFTTHPDDVQRLSSLPSEDFFREIGKIEARLDAAPVKSGPASAPKVSNAKALIQPVSASPPSPDPLAVTDDLEVDEFIRRGNAADRARRRA